MKLPPVSIIRTEIEAVLEHVEGAVPPALRPKPAHSGSARRRAVIMRMGHADIGGAVADIGQASARGQVSAWVLGLALPFGLAGQHRNRDRPGIGRACGGDAWSQAVGLST